MSYRFCLFDLGDDTRVAAAHAWLEAQEQAVVAGTAARGTAPAWHAQLCAALNQRHPDLRYEAVAAHAAWAPFAQLADADDGVELQLYSSSVSLSVPFWYSGEQAQHVLLRAGDYLKTVSDVTGFAIYDPQLDALINPHADLPRVLERYKSAAKQLRQWAEQGAQAGANEPHT